MGHFSIKKSVIMLFSLLGQSGYEKELPARPEVCCSNSDSLKSFKITHFFRTETCSLTMTRQITFAKFECPLTFLSKIWAVVAVKNWITGKFSKSTQFQMKSGTTIFFHNHARDIQRRKGGHFEERKLWISVKLNHHILFFI